MAEKIPTGTLAHGSIFMCIGWHDEPLHSDPALILELPLTDGVLAFLVLEKRLVVEIGRIDSTKEEMTDQWITPELIRPEGAPVVVSLQWSDGKLSTFRLNSKEVPRAEAADEFVIDHCEDTFVTAVDPIRGQQICLNLRQQTVPMSLAFMQLQQWVTRLEAHLETQRSNTPELTFEIANCLRTLLCGTQKNGGSLLFKCAEEIKIDLVCYTVPEFEGNSSVTFMDPNTIVFGRVPAEVPRGNMQVATDLQAWLSMPALITLDHRLKHWEFIREVADKYGSHADTDGAAISLLFMNPHRPTLNLGILESIFREYGKFALLMSRRLISSHRT